MSATTQKKIARAHLGPRDSFFGGFGQLAERVSSR